MKSGMMLDTSDAFVSASADVLIVRHVWRTNSAVMFVRILLITSANDSTKKPVDQPVSSTRAVWYASERATDGKPTS